MIEGLFISASGMLPKTTRHEAIANNLANSSTSGFKRRRLQFQDLLYQSLVVPGSASTQQTNVPTGLQIGLSGITQSWTLYFGLFFLAMVLFVKDSTPVAAVGIANGTEPALTLFAARAVMWRSTAISLAWPGSPVMGPERLASAGTSAKRSSRDSSDTVSARSTRHVRWALIGVSARAGLTAHQTVVYATRRALGELFRAATRSSHHTSSGLALKIEE